MSHLIGEQLRCKHLASTSTEITAPPETGPGESFQSAAAAPFPDLHPGTQSMKQLQCFSSQSGSKYEVHPLLTLRESGFGF